MSSPVQWISVQGALKPCRRLGRQSGGCKLCLLAPASLAHRIHCCYSQAVAGACVQALQPVLQVAAKVHLLEVLTVIMALQPATVQQLVTNTGV